MGADLYLESQYWHPRPTLVFVNRAGRLELFRDYFVTGYKKVPGSYQDSPEIRNMMTRLIGVQYVTERPV